MTGDRAAVDSEQRHCGKVVRGKRRTGYNGKVAGSSTHSNQLCRKFRFHSPDVGRFSEVPNDASLVVRGRHGHSKFETGCDFVDGTAVSVEIDNPVALILVNVERKFAMIESVTHRDDLSRRVPDPDVGGVDANVDAGQCVVFTAEWKERFSGAVLL